MFDVNDSILDHWTKMGKISVVQMHTALNKL